VIGVDPDQIRAAVQMALAEDLADGPDVTTDATIPADAVGVADIVAWRAGVVAGLAVAECAFAETGARGVAAVRDGDEVGQGEVLMTVTGPVRAILTAERTALNFLCHLSGIATLTRAWAVSVAGTGAAIRDTRKTIPGLRALEKYAVRCGGGVNHRMSLSDVALIKDNHVAAAGSVAAALRAIPPGVPVEVECDTLDQVQQAVAAGAELILLDNFGVDDMKRAVALVAGRARLEASGGLHLESAAKVAATGVDYLAVGALTHSAPALDIGLDLRADG
jgi:nicotinate-nucleotide pyrophosphorylase (carboxylating)